MKLLVEITCASDDQEDILHNFLQDDAELEQAIRDTLEECYGWYIDVISVNLQVGGISTKF